MSVLLHLVPSGTEARLGGALPLLFRLENRGAEPLWLSRRLLLNGSHAPPGLRDLVLDVLGPGGARPFASRISALLPDAGDYVRLAPGAALERAYADLLEDYLLVTPGTYVLRGTFHDQHPTPPAAPAGTRLFQGPVVSGSVTVRVTPPG